MTKQQTATIYQFPKRARQSSDSEHQMKRPALQHHAAAPQYAAMEFGRGWYHEAALAEPDEDCELPHQQH